MDKAGSARYVIGWTRTCRRQPDAIYDGDVRVLQESASMESPDVRDVIVAAQEHEVPAVGDQVIINGECVRVLEVGKWRERSSTFDRDREMALEIRVHRDDQPGAGVAEVRPRGPGGLIAGAEAAMPTEDESHQ